MIQIILRLGGRALLWVSGRERRGTDRRNNLNYIKDLEHYCEWVSEREIERERIGGRQTETEIRRYEDIHITCTCCTNVEDLRGKQSIDENEKEKEWGAVN